MDDAELKQLFKDHTAHLDARLDRLAVELREYVDESAKETRRYVDTSAKETRQYVDTRLSAMDVRLDAIDTRLDAIDARLDAMERRIDDVAAQTRAHSIELSLETRREMGVLVEGLRHEVQILAEQVMENNAKLDRLDAKVDDLFGQLDKRVTRLEIAAFGTIR